MKSILKKFGKILLAVGLVFTGVKFVPVNAQTNKWDGKDTSDFNSICITNYCPRTRWNINPNLVCRMPNGHLQEDSEFMLGNSYGKYSSLPLWCFDPEVYTRDSYDGPAVSERPVNYITKKYANNNFEKGNQMWNKIEQILYFGYGFDGNESNEMRFATQIHIWEVLTGENIALVKDPKGKVRTCYNLISERLSKCIETPSFHDQTIVLKGYGEANAIEITDTKGVFESYESLKSTDSKLKTKKEGNKLKVWAEEGVEQTGRVSGVNRWFENHAKNNFNYFSTPQSTVGTVWDMGKNSQSCFVFLGYDSMTDPVAFRLNVKMQTGEVTVEKQDAETGTKTQGEATFKGAKFDLYDKATNKKVAGQTTITVNANGKGDHVWKNLDTTKQYIVKETGAPAGYLLNSKGVNVQFEEKDGKKISHSIIKDTVIKGKVSIHKTYLPDNMSGIPVNEEGAEFEVRQNYGNKEVVATLVTDKDGNAISGDLPYGKYTLKQTKAGGEYAIDEHTYEFSITKDKEVIPYGVIVNTENEYGIQIVKKDETTGECITYTGAKFQFYKDGEDKPVSVKVGKKQYDTFVTRNSSTDKGAKNEFYASDEDEMGTIETPLVLKAGKYRMVEIEAPKGYEKQTYDIEVGQGAMTRVDEDGKPIVVIEATDKPYMDTLEFEKKLQTYSQIKYDPTEIEFTLFAKTDYISMVNGKVIAKAGSPVQTVRGLIEDNKIVFRFNPVYVGEFILKETAVPDGIAIDKTEHQYSVSEKGAFYDGKVKVDPIIIVNEESTTTFSKVDAGGEEVVGAKMKLTDENGKVIDEWTSGKVAHVVYGLIEGKKYTLHEDLAPTGLNLAQDITFTAGVKNHVKMVDTKTLLSKTENGSDKMVKGAVLEVIDKSGKVYDKWTSNGKVHEVKGLTIGETYIVRELKAPKGYVKGKDKEFTVVKDKDTVIQYENRREIITGVSTGITPIAFAVIAVITLLGIGGYSYYKKKK